VREDRLPRRLLVLQTSPEERPLSEHIDALCSRIKHAAGYLQDLKRWATVLVFVFLGYRSNVDHTGIEIPLRLPGDVHDPGNIGSTVQNLR
jgi:hypothetical protein